ncbi:hypothetical protein [Haloferula sp. BvORR071]|uniref:hypothetical protein n=1 Tax=Haloferula sp. BvORR071 TaxID=1396141 RepID=UPI0005549E9A|nr:hypothetical protein [Haloferula sp. BvORR071]
MLIPLAASPVRICLVETKAAASCCAKCKQKHTPECCLDVERLPKAQPPATPVGLPPAAAIDLPPVVFELPPVNLVPLAAFDWFEPIRGPDTPCCLRARLGVWRL